MMDAHRVLVAVKGTDLDEDLVRLACRSVRENHGVVHVVYVIEVPRSQPVDAEDLEESERGEKLLQATERIAHEAKCKMEADVLQARDAGPAVVQEAVDRNVDLIFIATPYKRHSGEFTLGNTVPFILKNAPCGVIFWRGFIRQKISSALS
jgi:nucleotide-binding universal stress UspA family protein